MFRQRCHSCFGWSQVLLRPLFGRGGDASKKWCLSSFVMLGLLRPIFITFQTDIRDEQRKPSVTDNITRSHLKDLHEQQIAFPAPGQQIIATLLHQKKYQVDITKPNPAIFTNATNSNEECKLTMARYYDLPLQLVSIVELST